MNEVFPVQPLFDNVFVKKDDASTTESGLHLPQSIKGRAVTGTVVAVGPGHLDAETAKFVPCGVKVGDRVFLRAFDGSIIRYAGFEVFGFKEADILGVLDEAIGFPVKPLFDNVFVKKDDDSKTASGLYKPQSVKGRAVTGIVVAAGPGHLNVETARFVPCSVKAGDKVFLREYGGDSIKYKEDELLVYKDMEILGILKEGQ